ncbi:MAG: hypothetical protein O7E56_12010 [SAR324 cluster bacterium]|nr:hypothetical protein [SAR324 cluster bacterium]
MSTQDWHGRYGLAEQAAVELASQLAALPASQEATQNLERLFDRIEGVHLAFLAESPVPAALARMAYAAPFLLGHLARHPEPLAAGLLSRLHTPAALLPWPDYCSAERLAGLEPEELMRRLRLWKYGNYLRLTAQELLEIHPASRTCELLSDLADGMLATAFRHAFLSGVARHGLPLRQDGAVALGAVIGMGKLGGRELNYASDVDVIFIHDGDESLCRPLAKSKKTPHPALAEADYWAAWQAMAPRGKSKGGEGGVSGDEFYNRLARQVVRLLSTTTGDGIGFRVDVDLRPQGKSGLLAPSLGFLAQYYDVHGREWERTALLKARAVAGAPAVSARFQEIVRPFVYRRYLDYSAVEGMAIIKHDINRNHGAGLERNLKLGAGGIRENEFLVQALQLLYGGRKPALQVTSHAQAVARLVEAGVLEEQDARAHLEDYWLLRGIENRVQMVQEAQTHELPEEAGALTRVLADFRPGFADRQAEAEAALADARRRIGERFQQLFAELGSEEYPQPELWRQAIREHTPAGEREVLLARVDSLLNGLMHTRLGERCVFKVARLLIRPEIYRKGTDDAFPRWLDFLDQIGNRNAIHTLIDANPRVVTWASTIFAEGGMHALALIRHPQFVETFHGGVGAGDGGIAEPFQAILEHARDEEEFILELQMAKAQALIQILTIYLSAPGRQTHRGMLSDLADATVSLCAAYAWRLTAARYGLPEGASSGGQVSGFAVLAMGKLGSREMRFGSDLDLAFLYDRDGSTSGGKSHYEFYTRVAQKLGTLLTSPTQFGKLYELDHRLRPFGSKGVLVPTLSGYQGFLQEAEVWNFQAFTRLRFLCGAPELGDALLNAVEEAWRKRAPAPGQVARAVREMLGRLVSEHAPPGAATGWLPLKYAVGGLIGFEFLRQCRFLQAQGDGENGWNDPADHEGIRALRGAYDTLGALDERMGFHEPAYSNEVAPLHFAKYAAIGGAWNYEQVRSLVREMEDGVERGFAEMST